MTDERVPATEGAVLAIDASGRSLAVGVFAGDGCVAARHVDEPYQHSRQLIAAVAQVMREAAVAPQALTLIAVTQGPGSYTGLRLGAMAAKTLAWAWDVPIAGVNALAVLALQAGAPAVIASLPARRGELYVQAFAGADDAAALHPLGDVAEGATETVLAQLGRTLPAQFRWTLAGPGWETIELERVAALLDRQVVRAGEDADRPRAGTVAALGRLETARGRLYDAMTFAPSYLAHAVARGEPPSP